MPVYNLPEDILDEAWGVDHGPDAVYRMPDGTLIVASELTGTVETDKPLPTWRDWLKFCGLKKEN
jgi:hypothetical protein